MIRPETFVHAPTPRFSLSRRCGRVDCSLQPLSGSPRRRPPPPDFHPPPNLQPAIAFATGDCCAYGVAAADIDNDGDVDLVVTHEGVCIEAGAFGPCTSGAGSVAVLRNNGDWSDPSTALSAEPFLDLDDLADPNVARPREIALARIDADVLPDIVLVTVSGHVVVLYNQNGSFSAAAGATFPLVVGQVRRPANGVTVGDLDADGFNDVGVATWGDDEASEPYAFRLFNDGSGGFNLTQAIDLSQEISGVTWDIVAGRFDSTHNGFDLVACNRDDNSVTVIESRARPNFFVNQVDAPQGSNWGFMGIARARLNAGSKPDIAGTERTQGWMDALIGDGMGGFTHDPAANRAKLHPQPINNDPFGVAVRRLNFGNQRDVVAALKDSDEISVQLGLGDGTFPFDPLLFSVAPGDMPKQVLVVDLNDDGLNDVVTTNWLSANISVLLNAPSP